MLIVMTKYKFIKLINSNYVHINIKVQDIDMLTLYAMEKITNVLLLVYSIFEYIYSILYIMTFKNIITEFLWLEKSLLVMHVLLIINCLIVEVNLSVIFCLLLIARLFVISSYMKFLDVSFIKLFNSNLCPYQF